MKCAEIEKRMKKVKINIKKTDKLNKTENSLYN